MANQIQATVYQIDGNPLPSPKQISFLTSDILMRTNSISTIAEVQSSITYYPNTSNQLQEQTFFVSEELGYLLTEANTGGTSQVAADVLEINGDPLPQNGVIFTFPANGISMWETIDGLMRVNTTIEFKNKAYGVSDSLTSLVIAANTSGSGGFITISKAELDILVGDNALVPGQFYMITGVNVDLYGGTDVILQAATTNKLESQGSGLFYNPRYDGGAIWTKYMSVSLSNISAPFNVGESVKADNGAIAIFLSNGLLDWSSGDWSTAVTILGHDSGSTADISGAPPIFYNIGNYVIWGGKVWVNLYGNVGDSLDAYSLDAQWEVIPYNTVDYNLVVDEIKYDYEFNAIVYRRDYSINLDNNIVDGGKGFGYGAIKAFQWGNEGKVYANQIINSYCENINFRGDNFRYNTISQNSYIGDGNIFESGTYFEYNTLSENSYVGGNTLSNGSGIDYNTLNDSAIYNSQLSQGSDMYANELLNSAFYYNQLTQSGMYYNNLTESTIDNNILYLSCNIQNNTILQNSNIQNNTINNNSNIQNNDLSQSSRIGGNTSSSQNDIQFNTLSLESQIKNNTLIELSDISYNTLTISSVISTLGMIFSSVYGNDLKEESSIFNHDMNSGYIEYNTLSNSVIRTNGMINDSYISSNTLSGGSGITNNNMDGAEIGFNSLSSQSAINGNSAVVIYENNLSQESNINNCPVGASIAANNLFSSMINLESSPSLVSTLAYITMNYAKIDVDISAATDIYGDYTKNIIKADDAQYYLTYISALAINPYIIVHVNN